MVALGHGGQAHNLGNLRGAQAAAGGERRGGDGRGDAALRDGQAFLQPLDAEGGAADPVMPVLAASEAHAGFLPR